MVKAQYPGAPSARVVWSFEGNSSDLTHFHVLTQVDGEETHQDVCSSKAQYMKKVIDFEEIFFCAGNKGTVVKGLVPLKSHQISVIAVYKDDIEQRGHMEYIHTGMF